MTRHDARWVALELLRQVEIDDAYANLALPKLLRHYRLDEREAAFATELAFGTLRLQGRYDAVIDACANRELDPGVRAVLRLGAHQVLTLAVPDYAAVDATVSLARAEFGRGPSGFVNAVMRRITTRDWPGWAAQVVPPLDRDPLAHWEVAQSHPKWIVAELRTALGERAEELEALLATNNTAGPVTMVARPGRLTQAELIADTGGRPGRWSPWAVRAGGDPARIAAVRSGAAGVQDEGSQLMALALARAEVAGADESWLDLCAGPGGKTADLAGLAAAAGATLTAVEQHEHRAELIRRAVAGGPPVTVVTADARTLPAQPQRYDRVLLDAPCTGLGAVRRRPELRWRRSPRDLRALVAAQRQLLDSALAVLRPGGVVAYVTCSPVLAETRDVVAAATQRPDVELLPAAELLPEVPGAAVGAAVQLWPHRHDTDAMFLALLRRR